MLICLKYLRFPLWYDVKLAFVAWLVLPQFRGAAFIYEKYVRELLFKKYAGGALRHSQYPNTSKLKTKFVDFMTPNKVSTYSLLQCVYFDTFNI